MNSSERTIAICVLEKWLKKLEEKDENFVLGNLRLVLFDSIADFDNETSISVRLHYIKKK